MAPRFGIKNECYPGGGGSKPAVKNDTPQTGAETEDMCGVSYQEAVKTLIYVATMSQTDLSYAMQMAKFNDNSGPAHWKVTKRALQYIWRMKGLENLYEGVHRSDYATCPDTK